MAKIGLADDQLLTEQIACLDWNAGDVAGHRRWAQYRSDDSDSELVQLADRALADPDFGENREYVDSVMSTDGSR